MPASLDPTIEQSRVLLQFVRGRALDAYSGFEQIYMEVLRGILGTDMGTAGIIYFKITGSNLRNRMIEDLIIKKFSDQYSVYWFGSKNKPALMELIRQVDDVRNHIAHWKPIFRDEIGEFVLRPPNLWNSPKNYPFHSIDDLCEFKAKCDCVRHYLGNFNWRTTRYQEGADTAHARAWLDKFNKPPAYPPLDKCHPLNKLWEEQRMRPRLFLS